ncbi:hypothetical protein J2W17_006234 [Pseudomonas lini]|nr:hypothetical protein [Pseudomonas lini]
MPNSFKASQARQNDKAPYAVRKWVELPDGFHSHGEGHG